MNYYEENSKDNVFKEGIKINIKQEAKNTVYNVFGDGTQIEIISIYLQGVFWFLVGGGVAYAACWYAIYKIGPEEVKTYNREMQKGRTSDTIFRDYPVWKNVAICALISLVAYIFGSVDVADSD